MLLSRSRILLTVPQRLHSFTATPLVLKIAIIKKVVSPRQARRNFVSESIDLVWRDVFRRLTLKKTETQSDIIKMLRFDDRVAIVTGAGGGLGRAYALLLASRGASVVVNDLGGTRDGGGQSTKAADEVVREIKEKGGKAVANYDSVEHGEKLVQTALSSFGRIDIVINNAGILRDKSFARTSDSDWDLVHKVHLRGAFQVTRAAWPHMKKQGYGRIVMTSSVAGIFGNFGQANYSAAKLGLIGLSNTLAVEGQKNDIKCNVIVPMAASRLTEDILPPDMLEKLKPDLIAPVVAFLCHEDCPDSGSIIEAAGGWAAKYRWQRSQGCVLMDSNNQEVSPEKVKENWNKITDMEDGNFPESNQAATMDFVSKMESFRESNRSTEVSEKGILAAVGYESKGAKFAYNHRDVILYALGLGVSTENAQNLKFLYEGDPDFCTLPTFSVIPSISGLMDLIGGKVPGLNIDLSRILHGEQYTEIFNPLPTDGTCTSTNKIVDILDKGSGCVILCNVDSKIGDELYARNQLSIFVVGSGGFGGPRSSNHAVKTIPAPQRKPDKVSDKRTTIDQAALYRLSGDSNPLHIDPAFAQLGGFDRPILHGLCSYGIAVKEVVDAFCGGDPARVKAIKARFAKPVFPGQTLRTEMWQEGNKILFTCKVVETNQTCLSGGWVELTQEDTGRRTVTSKVLESDGVFKEMSHKLKEQPDVVRKIGASYLWQITQNGKVVKHWMMDLKTSPGSIVVVPEGAKADCVLTIADEDMVNMTSGKLNPQSAFMKGLLKVKGNIMLTQKLQSLLGNSSKL